MIIQNTNVAITFPKVENIKSKYLDNKNFLKERFNEANILPIPDDAPIEIPRILIKSKGEHSQVSISPNVINLQTIYSNNYTNDWEICEKYIDDRINDIFDFADEITGAEYCFIGVVTNLIINEAEENAHKRLYENLFNKAAPKNLEDLIVRYTYNEENKYYVNITLQSAKIYNNVNNNKFGQFTADKSERHSINIEIDINDRYSYNENVGYISNRQHYSAIMDLTTKVIKEKLNNLVERGEY